jgi:hypothetical protein
MCSHRAWSIPILDRLMWAGADTDARKLSGHTALALAVPQKGLDAMEMLLDHADGDKVGVMF